MFLLFCVSARRNKKNMLNKEIINIYIKILILILLVCTAPLTIVAQNRQESKNQSAGRTASRITVQGQIVDSLTNLPLDFVNIAEIGTTNGTITDTEGRFSMLVRSGSTISISSLGYDPIKIIAGNKRQNLTIKMVPTDIQLSEVVVKPKRERYRRKDNPAVALIRNVIAHKDDHSPSKKDFFKHNRYDNITYSLNNFDEFYVRQWKKKFKFIEEFVDTAVVSGAPVLPVTTDERVETHYFNNKNNTTRVVTEAEKHAGLDDMLPEDVVAILKKEVFPELDLADDNIFLYRKKFVSPTSSFGPTFYKYYILDTLKLNDDQKYIDLGFAPAMPQSFGFVGHLYVSLDSTYWVKHAELNIPPEINLNFVRNMHVEVDYDRLPDSTRVVSRKSFDSELNITSGSLGFYAHRIIRYSDFDDQEPQEMQSIFSKAPMVDSPNLLANNKNPDFWKYYRKSDDFEQDKSVEAMMGRMRQVPFYRYTEMVLGWLFKGFVPIDGKPEDDSRLMIGPCNAIASWNQLEHMRFRVGGITTANVNHHLFGAGYVAYGIEDHKWKYDASLEYSFRRKKMFANEFPIHSLKLESTFDSRELGLQLFTNRDNFVTSFRRTADPKFTYVRSNSLLYTLEFWNHFSMKLKAEMRREYNSRLGRFDEVGSGINMPHYDLSLATINLRWAPKESFMQMRTSRIRVDDLHPVFELTHEIAKKGVLGSDFDFQRTEFKFLKRFWLNVLGYADVDLTAGKVWTQSPYTLLSMPNANTGYTIQRGAFSQLNSMEFIYDQYASWNIVWKLNGFVFNNLPLIRHLKLREIVSFRGVYGKLSDKNDPDMMKADGITPLNPNLYKFPSNGTVYRLGNEPYMEVAFGIDNIFKVLRVEYIRRLNYLDHEHISKHGIQIALGLNF